MRKIFSFLVVVMMIFISIGTNVITVKAAEPAKWEVIMSGLSQNPTLTGFFDKDGVAYFADKGSVYTWSEDNYTWERLAIKTPNKYGYQQVLLGGDNRIYTKINGGVFVLNEEENIWIKLDNVPKDLGNLAATSTGFVGLMRKTTKNPVIMKYDSGKDECINLEFSFKNLDGKPHIQLLEDKQDRIWYKSNYSGIYKYEDGTWTKENDKSGQLGVSEDGTVYLSYEIQKTTQISSFFKYTEDNEWKLVMTSRGYGIRMESMEEESYVVALGGRFPSLVVGDGKSVKITSTFKDLGLNSKEQKSVSDRKFFVLDNYIYDVQSYSKNKKKYTRVMRLKVDIDSITPYKTDLELSAAGYIGDSEFNQAVGVDVINNDEAVVALNSTDKGKIVVIDTNSNNIEKTIELENKILDLKTTTGSSIVVATPEQIKKMDIDNETLSWSYSNNANYKKVDVDDSGNIIALMDKNIVIFDSEGNVKYEREFKHSYIKDVAVKDDKFYFVGFDNKRINGKSPVQVAFLYGYDFEGNMLWRKFGFDGNNLSRNIADTRLYKVNFGEDGMLYILGESAGSQTIFRYDGNDYSGKEIISKIDFYNDLWNTGSAHIAYYASVNPENGEIKSSQLTMARLSKGKSNTFKVGDIAADSNGDTYVVGVIGASLAARGAQTINGEEIGQYCGSDPTYLALNNRFTQRHNWTSFTKDQGKGKVISIAISNNKKLLLGQVDGSGEWFTTGDFASSENENIKSNVWFGIIEN